jgi:CheY-like chemotaxis protein
MAAPPPSNLPDLRGVTILLVDDDNDSLEILGEFFRACGAHPLAARHAAGASAYLDTAPKLDAIITDLAMPDMDGMEFVRRVRRHPTRNKVPVIAVTAFYETYPNAPDFDAWLKKPLNLAEVGVLLERLVRRARNP